MGKENLATSDVSEVNSIIIFGDGMRASIKNKFTDVDDEETGIKMARFLLEPTPALAKVHNITQADVDDDSRYINWECPASDILIEYLLGPYVMIWVVSDFSHNYNNTLKTISKGFPEKLKSLSLENRQLRLEILRQEQRYMKLLKKTDDRFKEEFRLNQELLNPPKEENKNEPS